jgi:secreted trypsin-like serine protease
VVTAAHCVVVNNGIVTNNVYVGQAGSQQSSITLDDMVKSVEITSTYSGGSNSTVGNDDLAFLVLGKPQTIRVPIRLASESEVTSFKSANAPLKALGYGYYSDAGTEATLGPKSFAGTFSQTASSFNNSAYMQSSSGHACQGDSGGPIVTTSASAVVLVGIITGGQNNIHCSKRLSDGNYYALFTLISRYANLAFGAASKTITDLQTQLDDLKSTSSLAISAINNLRSQNADLTSQLENSNVSLSEARNQISELEDQVASLQARLPSTITCTKGKLTQKVTGVKPKCPAGFKLKP